MYCQCFCVGDFKNKKNSSKLGRLCKGQYQDEQREHFNMYLPQCIVKIFTSVWFYIWFFFFFFLSGENGVGRNNVVWWFGLRIVKYVNMISLEKQEDDSSTGPRHVNCNSMRTKQNKTNNNKKPPPPPPPPPQKQTLKTKLDFSSADPPAIKLRAW